MLDVLRQIEIDFIDLEQRKITLVILGWPDLTADGVAGAQIEAPDLAGRHVDIVGTGQIGTVGRAQKAEPILQDFEHAFAENILTLFRLGFKNAKNNILATHAGRMIAPHTLQGFDQLGDSVLLQLV